MNFPVPDPLEARLQKFEEELQKRQKKLQELQAMNQYGLFNREYTVDIECPAMVANVRQVFKKALTIRDGTVFYVTETVQSYLVTGALESDPTVSGQMPLPESTRVAVFDYRYRIRDTGRDREWSNAYAPSVGLQTANRSGLRTPRSKAVLPAGSKVEVSIDAIFFGNDAQVTGLHTITKHKIQISFLGGERRL